MDMTGALDRSNFGTADEQEHYWFRARLVQRLAADAEHVVLFPRQELRHELRELLGIDVTSEPQRYTVVPEGIDLAVTEAARQDVAQRAAVAALHELEELVEGSSPERHGLPLVISVGRLHRVKGMATVVEAWATDPGLRDRCNLVIVGGDLDRPSARRARPAPAHCRRPCVQSGGRNRAGLGWASPERCGRPLAGGSPRRAWVH